MCWCVCVCVREDDEGKASPSLLLSRAPSFPVCVCVCLSVCLSVCLCVSLGVFILVSRSRPFSLISSVPECVRLTVVVVPAQVKDGRVRDIFPHRAFDLRIGRYLGCA